MNKQEFSIKLYFELPEGWDDLFIMYQDFYKNQKIDNAKLLIMFKDAGLHLVKIEYYKYKYIKSFKY